MATVAELRAQAEALLAQAEEQEANDKRKLFDGVIKKLADSGYTLDELLAYVKPKRKSLAGIAIEMKYAGPNGELYSGRGHHPSWLKEAIAGGKKLEDFLIKKSA